MERGHSLCGKLSEPAGAYATEDMQGHLWTGTGESPGEEERGAGSCCWGHSDSSTWYIGACSKLTRKAVSQNTADFSQPGNRHRSELG